MFNFQANASAQKQEKPVDFAKNRVAMAKEWEVASAKMDEIQKLARGLAGGKFTSPEQAAETLKELSTKIAELKDSKSIFIYNKDGKKDEKISLVHLLKDTSLVYCLEAMSQSLDVISKTKDPSIAVKNIMLLDSNSTYFLLKIDAYQKLSEIMETVQAGKLDEALKAVEKGKSQVFLGALSSDMLKDFKAAIKGKDAAKAGAACGAIFEDVKSIPTWGTDLRLSEAVIAAKDPFYEESTAGKIASWVPFAGPVRDVVRGIKHMSRDGTGTWYKDGQGWMLVGMGVLGLGLDVASIFTFGATTIVKTAGRKLMIAEMGNSFKGTARRQAQKELGEVFTTKELKNITEMSLEKNVLPSMFKRLETDGAGLVLKDGAAGKLIPDTEIAEKLIGKVKTTIIEEFFAKAGGKLTREEVAKAVNDIYEPLLVKIEQTLIKRNGSAVMKIGDQKLIEDMVLKESKSVAKKLSTVAMEKQAGLKAVEKNLAKSGIHGEMTNSLKAAVSAVNSDEWLGKVTNASIDKTSRFWKAKNAADVKKVIDKEIVEAFGKAFKEVPEDILKKAKFSELVEEMSMKITKDMAGEGVTKSELKKLIKIELKETAAKIEAEVGTAITESVRKQAVVNVLKANPGATALTAEVKGLIEKEMELLGLQGGEATEQLLKEVVEEQAKTIAKKPIGSLYLWSLKRAKTSFAGDAETAYLNVGKPAEWLMKGMWMPAKLPYHATRTALAYGADLVAQGTKKTGKLAIKLGEDIAYTDLTYTAAARGAHWGANVKQNYDDRRESVPIKYAQVLPEQAFDALFRQAYGEVPESGKVYVRIDGGATAVIKRKNGGYDGAEASALLLFGRHQVEMSLRDPDETKLGKAMRKIDLKREIQKKIMLVEVSQPLLAIEAEHVVVYAPNGARLAGQELVLIDKNTGKKQNRKTDADGKIIYGNAEFVPAENKIMSGKDVFVPIENHEYILCPGKEGNVGKPWGTFMVSNGSITVKPPAGQASQTVAPTNVEAGAQQQFDAIISAANASHKEWCDIIVGQKGSFAQPLIAAVEKMKSMKVSEEDAANTVVGYLGCIYDKHLAEWPAQLEKIAEKGMVTQKYIDGLNLNAAQKALLKDIDSKNLGTAFLGKVNYLFLQVGDSEQNAVLAVLDGYDKKDPAGSLTIQ